MKTKPLSPHGEKIELTQPYEVDFTTADGVFIKQVVVRNAGTWLPQHAHKYDHTTMLAKGKIFAWKDGQLDKQYAAPAALFIAAGVKHLFQTLVDDTILYCIHNAKHEKVAEVLAEHEMSEYDLTGAL